MNISDFVLVDIPCSVIDGLLTVAFRCEEHGCEADFTEMDHQRAGLCHIGSIQESNTCCNNGEVSSLGGIFSSGDGGASNKGDYANVASECASCRSGCHFSQHAVLLNLCNVYEWSFVCGVCVMANVVVVGKFLLYIKLYCYNFRFSFEFIHSFIHRVCYPSLSLFVNYNRTSSGSVV